MATTDQKYRLITLPNETLRKPSRKIGLISAEVKSVVNAMQQTTIDWEDSREHEVGVALAAVQLGQLMRIVIIRNNINEKEDRSFSVFINPVITKYEGNQEVDFEGCLSIQSIYGKVPRYQKVRVKAIGLNGREFRVTVDGFLARTF